MLLVLATVAALVVVLMTQRLDDQVDSALRDDVLAAAPRLARIVASGVDAPLPAVQPAAGAALEGEHDRHDDDAGEASHGGAEHGSAEGALRELAEHAAAPTHQLLLDLDGRLLESTLSATTQPLSAAVRAAQRDDLDLRTVDLGRERIRVRTERVSLAGEAIGYVQAFRSLERRDESAADLIRIFLIAGGVAGLAALGAGFWLSGRALAPIQRNLEAQRRFVADASHELRTPIAVVQSSADVLLRRPDRSLAEEQEVVEAIREEAGRMGALVRDLLDLGTIDQAPLATQPLDLRGIAVEAVGAIEPQAQAAGVTLTVEPGSAVGAMGDAATLSQVVRILLDNAIKHTGPGTRVRVSAAAVGRAAELRVADDGPGIPDADRARVFE
ncbi:MAG: HAMP domain-containing histidine kinase, partial [Chloroflexi bacterium]|nr:HAMP domain-containing histidine kinase [Chloroflexota bacterium]